MPLESQVTQSQRFKTNIKELVHCRLFSVSGWFWSRSGFFFRFSSSYHSFLLRVVRGRKSKKNKNRMAPNHPETEKRRQWTSNVWFNSFIFFNIRFKPLRLGYLCLNQRLERRRLRRRRTDSNKNSFGAPCEPRSTSTSTKRVFHNLEMAHIKFDSSMQK